MSYHVVIAGRDREVFGVWETRDEALEWIESVAADPRYDLELPAIVRPILNKALAAHEDQPAA